MLRGYHLDIGTNDCILDYEAATTNSNIYILEAYARVKPVLFESKEAHPIGTKFNYMPFRWRRIIQRWPQALS